MADESENQTMPDAKPRPANTDIEVVNPRYEGSTFEMVADALLQRPRKRPDQDDDEPTDDSAHSPT